jgi:hypothetical protein
MSFASAASERCGAQITTDRCSAAAGTDDSPTASSDAAGSDTVVTLSQQTKPLTPPAAPTPTLLALPSSFDPRRVNSGDASITT